MRRSTTLSSHCTVKLVAILLASLAVISVMADGPGGKKDDAGAFTYRSFLPKERFSTPGYANIIFKDEIYSKAEGLEKAGLANAADRLREGVRNVQRMLDSISEEERRAIEMIWKRGREAKMLCNIYFKVTKPPNSKKIVVTALGIDALSGPENSKSDGDMIVDAICTLRELRWISLRNIRLQRESFRKLKDLKRLEFLDAPVNITDEVLLMLLRELSFLEYIELWGCRKVTGAFASDEQAGKHLREILMIGTGLDERGVDSQKLISIMMLPEMRLIKLDGVNIYVDDGSGLQRLNRRGK